ncbi:hypothetical protein MauCBS54593_000354 [Microsporum audouinii]
MFESALPLTPPVILFASACFIGILQCSYLTCLAIYAAITASAGLAIFNPPFNNAFLNYLSGFFSFWYIIWSTSILFIYRPSQLQRLQRYNSPIEISYRWEPLPPPFTYRRALWAWDLTTNYRGVGWEHAMPKGGYSPLNVNTRVKSKDFHQRLACISKQARRIITAYVLLDLAQSILHISWTDNLLWARTPAEIVAPGLALFGFTDGLHALTALVGVGLLDGEEWMYPTLFGKLEHFKRMRIKDLWGRVWHDLFRNGLLSLGQAVVPNGPGVLLVCFILSGLLHAAGSYSASLDTEATMWVLLFFCVQPVGVVLQEYIAFSVTSVAGELKAHPAVQKIRQTLVFTAGVIFIYNTFPWACQDPGLLRAIQTASLPLSIVRLVLGLF